MTDLTRIRAEQAERRRQERAAMRETAAAYQAVFDGVPTRDDQAIVLRDLDEFCGLEERILKPGSADETAERAGMMRVWQHIHQLRIMDVKELVNSIVTETRNGKGQEPTRGGGVTHTTLD